MHSDSIGMYGKEVNMSRQTILSDKIFILDGASGTQLQARGLPPSVCPERWALENPHALEDLQNAYIEAGSNIVYTFTFGASRLKLSEYGEGDNVFELNRDLAALSKKIAGTRALVAGDISSMGKHLKPYGDLPFEEAVAYFKEQAKGLLEGGVDLFVIETMSDIQEARAALLAVKELTDLPVMVSVTFEKDGKTLTGTTPKVAVQILQSLGADVVGCNCSSGPDKMIDIIREMKEVATVPVLAKPNAGVPRLEGNKTVFDMNPSTFSEYGKLLAEAGVNFIGGCCGTSPKHIFSLSLVINGMRSIPPFIEYIPPMLTSSRKGVFVGPSFPFAIIGERINPTGKKKLQEELREGSTSIVGTFAAEQIEAGASLLDMNVGMPGIDEKATMIQVVEYVSSQYDLPLCIDSSNPEVLEAALRIYPGRALINSVSLEKVKIEKVLPLAKKYGAMLIALPLGDEGIPDTLDKMKDNLNKILLHAEKLGIPLSYFIADGMVMSASAKQQNTLYTLDFIEWCTKSFGIGTVLGLSNVSFGLPDRKWVNATFLAMAMCKGLSLAIANPSSELIVNVAKAAEILTGNDINSARYIDHFSASQSVKEEIIKSVEDNTSKLYKAVIRGNKDGILDIFKTCLNEGVAVSVLVNDFVIPAITEVGNKFGDGTYFLPQLLLSAEAVKRVMEFVEADEGLNTTVTTEKKGTIVLATVKGDVHDIGKNIVGLLLKNHGYEVIDLGKDIPSEKIVDEAIDNNADIVGLSALMTTTMVEMREVVKLAKEKGLKSKIIIGGAVVTQRYADEIQADGYSSDANEAVLLVKKLLSK